MLKLILSLLVLLTGCSANHEKRHWTEDVQMEDRSIVTIERDVEFDATNALGGGAGNAVESKSVLRFAGDFAALPAWDFPRIPLVLYKSSQAQHWVIVGTTLSCEIWAKNG